MRYFTGLPISVAFTVLFTVLAAYLSTNFERSTLASFCSLFISLCVSAYLGLRFTQYQQRKEEFDDLKAALWRWVSLINQREEIEHFTNERDPDRNKDAPLALTILGFHYLWQLRIMLGNVSDQLEDAGHLRLAKQVGNAASYYAALAVHKQPPLQKEQNLLDKAKGMAASIKDSRPNTPALFRNQRLPSTGYVGQFYVDFPKSLITPAAKQQTKPDCCR